VEFTFATDQDARNLLGNLTGNLLGNDFPKKNDSYIGNYWYL